MKEVIISLGSNSNPQSQLLKAIKLLEDNFGKLLFSKVYKSKALSQSLASDNKDDALENDYLNMVISFATAASPDELIKLLKQIEVELGRTPLCKASKEVCIDLDLLLYGDEMIKVGERCYPSEDAFIHSFVLAPMVDIAADKVDCYSHLTFAELWSLLDKKLIPLEEVPFQYNEQKR